MSHSSNPYAAPLADPIAIGFGPEPADLVPRRLEFKGHLTRRHHRDAVIKAGIRKDFRRAFKVIAILVVLYFVVVFVPLAAKPNKDAALVIRAIAATCFYAFGVGLFFWMQLRSLTVRLPSFQLVTGAIEGWLDRDELWIQSETYSGVFPLSMLVAAASNHDIGVLSFSADQTYWQTIPMDAFDDPPLARSVFSDLQRIRPPVMPQLDDQRRRKIPEQPFRFTPQGDAVHFAGKIHRDSANGTLFSAASRKITRRMWITLAVFLGCIFVGINISFQLGLRFAGFAAVWFTLVAAMVYLRLWRARRRAKEAGRLVAMYSKGWLDDQGYFAMTTLGQSRMSWSFFSRYEITDRVIAFYPSNEDAVCCPVAREAFADDEDWQRATELVRKKMAEAR